MGRRADPGPRAAGRADSELLMARTHFRICVPCRTHFRNCARNGTHFRNCVRRSTALTPATAFNAARTSATVRSVVLISRIVHISVLISGAVYDAARTSGNECRLGPASAPGKPKPEVLLARPDRLRAEEVLTSGCAHRAARKSESEHRFVLISATEHPSVFRGARAADGRTVTGSGRPRHAFFEYLVLCQVV